MAKKVLITIKQLREITQEVQMRAAREMQRKLRALLGRELMAHIELAGLTVVFEPNDLREMRDSILLMYEELQDAKEAEELSAQTQKLIAEIKQSTLQIKDNERREAREIKDRRRTQDSAKDIYPRVRNATSPKPAAPLPANSLKPTPAKTKKLHKATKELPPPIDPLFADGGDGTTDREDDIDTAIGLL